MFETNGIKIDTKFEEEEGKLHLSIDVKIKDTDIFPPLALDNKVVMDNFEGTLCSQILRVLNDQTFKKRAKGEKKIRRVPMIEVACNRCGRTFETEDFCCGQKTKPAKCPYCLTYLTVHKNQGEKQNVVPPT